MKKQEIALKIARRAGVTEGAAADALDRVVNQILAKVRRGEQADLPGLGHFSKGPDGSLVFTREDGRG